MFSISFLVKKIYFSRTLWIGIIFIAIEQALVAFSTFSIAELAKKILLKQGILLWLSMFFFSLIVVYLPSLFARIFLEKAKYESFGQYIVLFKQQFFNYPMIKNDRVFQSTRKPYIASEARPLIANTINTIEILLIQGLNIIFNVCVISYEINFYIFFCYIASLFFSYFIIFFTRNAIKHKVNREQLSRANLAKSTINAWDNIIVGNIKNYSLWYKDFLQKIKLAKQNNKYMVLVQEIIAFFSMSIAAIPIFCLIFYMFISHNNNQIFLVAALATLPRQIQILQCMNNLIYATTLFFDIAERNKILFNSLQAYRSKFAERKINWAALTVYYNHKKINTPSSIASFEQIIAHHKHGRYLVKGKNGTGKTLLLSILKHKISKKAVLLGCDMNLYFSGMACKHFSTGEKLQYYLAKIILEKELEIFLLDEWDANLDKTRTKKLNSLLDELAKQKIIIEVRHKMQI